MEREREKPGRIYTKMLSSNLWMVGLQVIFIFFILFFSVCVCLFSIFSKMDVFHFYETLILSYFLKSSDSMQYEVQSISYEVFLLKLFHLNLVKLLDRTFSL